MDCVQYPVLISNGTENFSCDDHNMTMAKKIGDHGVNQNVDAVSTETANSSMSAKAASNTSKKIYKRETQLFAEPYIVELKEDFQREHGASTVDTKTLEAVNFERYMSGYAGTYNTRQRLWTEINDRHYIPSRSHFQGWLKTKVDSSIITKAYLTSLAPSSAQKAGSIGALFAWFLCAHSNATDSLSTPVAFEKLHNDFDDMSPLKKAETMLSFYKWYEQMDCVTVSIGKIIHARADMNRIKRKEPVTMKTVIIHLIIHLRIVGTLEPGLSGKKSIETETDTIWRLITIASKVTSKANYGPVTPLRKFAISKDDILFLMKRHGPCDKLNVFQSWMACLLMTVVGEKPGSFVPDGEFMKGAMAVRDRTVQDKLIEGELHNDDDDDADESTELCSKQDKIMSAAFQGLRFCDVKVYRCVSHDGDPEGTVRLRATYEVHKTKNSRVLKYQSSPTGVYYPSKVAGKLDWSGNGCVALALLSVLNGHVCVDDIIDPEFFNNRIEKVVLISKKTTESPSPVFRSGFPGSCGQLTDIQAKSMTPIIQMAMQSFGLPYHGFSSRSLRQGFAQTLIRAYVNSVEEGKLISKDDLLDIIKTSSAWNSKQGLVYIESLMKELRSQAIVSDVGVTVMDWKRALWSTSVMSRFLGGYHPKPLKEKWTEIGNDVDLWKSKSMSVMNKCSVDNVCTYMNTTPVQYKPDIDAWCFKNVLKMKETVNSLTNLMTSNNINVDNVPFGKIVGILYKDREEMLCPISLCRMLVSGGSKGAREHMKKHTDWMKLLFVCPCETKFTERTTYNTIYRWSNQKRHNRLKHHRGEMERGFEFVYNKSSVSRIHQNDEDDDNAVSVKKRKLPSQVE